MIGVVIVHRAALDSLLLLLRWTLLVWRHVIGVVMVYRVVVDFLLVFQWTLLVWRHAIGVVIVHHATLDSLPLVLLWTLLV